MAAALPAETTVTVVVDRGLASVELIDLCQRLGWHYVMRLSVDPRQGVHVRLADGTVTPAWAVVPGAAQHWNGAVAVFKHHGWRAAQLTIIWPRRYAQPWLLLSDRPAGRAQVHEYRRRVQVEALYEDYKARGWDLEASKLRTVNRLNRLPCGGAICSASR
ncbi:hypothetical protein BH23CHL1_BH23CHL1_19870 [soil metagenome]